MQVKAYGAMIVAALITAVVVSILLKVIGLPEGDLHPMITGAFATVSGIFVLQKMKSSGGAETNSSE